MTINDRYKSADGAARRLVLAVAAVVLIVCFGLWYSVGREAKQIKIEVAD